jgi:hypothetical protein
MGAASQERGAVRPRTAGLRVLLEVVHDRGSGFRDGHALAVPDALLLGAWAAGTTPSSPRTPTTGAPCPTASRAYST